jgi:hypothetical protein
MSDFPLQGISKEELETAIRHEYDAYQHVMRTAKIYADSETDLRDRISDSFASPNTLSAKTVQDLVKNTVEFYRQVLEFGVRQERLTTLVDLYKKHFPGEEMESLDLSELERMIKHNLEVRTNQFDYLLRRLHGGLNQAVSNLLEM